MTVTINQHLGSSLGLRLAIFVAICGPLFSSSGQAQDESLSQEEKIQIMERAAASDNGRFLLSGTVVDEHGNQLSGVRVILRKAKIVGPFVDPEYEDETRTVNGSFSFDLRGYSSVVTTFERDGYYERKFLFQLGEATLDEDQVFGRRPVPERTFVRDNLRIVLEQIGNLVDLLEYRGVLEYTASGAGKALNFDLPAGDGDFRRVANVHDPNQLPRNCAYIIADTNRDGSIATIESRRPGSDVSITFPRRVRLIMNATNGGFVRLAPLEKRNVFHQMKTAPDSEYLRELVFDDSYFAERVSVKAGDEGGIKFYFKIDGKFGKGGAGVFPWDGKVVRVGVAFRLQPDGSRNLETKEPGDCDNQSQRSEGSEGSTP